MSKNTPIGVLDALALKDLCDHYVQWRPVLRFLAPDYAELIAAIVQVESSWNPQASRCEPKFYDRYIATNPEWIKRMEQHGWQLLKAATSWGLMQIMFTTAWERGYRGEPERLMIPEVGLLYGAIHFAHLMDRYEHKLDDAVAAYNAGSVRRTAAGEYENQGYVDKVFSVFQELKGQNIGS